MAESGRWKDNLLKSSLPLEQVVRRTLGMKGLGGLGSFAYLRSNEDGVPTEFSIDVVGDIWIGEPDRERVILTVLAECKYNHPTVRWVFSPHDEQALVISGCMAHVDQLTSRRFRDLAALQEFEKDFTYCNRGIELHESGFDPNGISRGLSQLRYGIPQLLNVLVREQLNTWHDEELFAHLVLPVLVTTAELWVLAPDLTVDAVQDAAALEDVAIKVPALIHHQRETPHLGDYASDVLSGLAKRQSNVSQRITERRGLEGGRNGHMGPLHELEHLYEMAPQNIVVANLEHLDDLVSSALDAAQLMEADLETLGTLAGDPKTNRQVLQPVRKRQGRRSIKAAAQKTRTSTSLKQQIRTAVLPRQRGSR